MVIFFHQLDERRSNVHYFNKYHVYATKKAKLTMPAYRIQHWRQMLGEKQQQRLTEA
jgi:hypothetical protein